jgi:hypothetical protein
MDGSENLHCKRRRERDIRRDSGFSAHSLGRLRIAANPVFGMLLTATDNASEDGMYKQRLEKFYREHPRGLSDSPPNNAEVIPAHASATRYEIGGLDEKKSIQDPAQVGVRV